MIAVLGLAALAVLAYARPLLFDQTFAVRDHLTHTLPSRSYLAANLRVGHWPEWWDGIRLGQRFAAEPNNSVTYPPLWLVALGDPLWATDLALILHVLLAGVGGLLLARRLGARPLGAFFAGASLMLSGYVTSMLITITLWIAVAPLAAATRRGKKRL